MPFQNLENFLSIFIIQFSVKGDYLYLADRQSHSYKVHFVYVIKSHSQGAAKCQANWKFLYFLLKPNITWWISGWLAMSHCGRIKYRENHLQGMWVQADNVTHSRLDSFGWCSSKLFHSWEIMDHDLFFDLIQKIMILWSGSWKVMIRIKNWPNFFWSGS